MILTLISDNSVIILPVSLLSLKPRFSPITLLAAVMQGQHPNILDFWGVSCFFLTDDTKMTVNYDN